LLFDAAIFTPPLMPPCHAAALIIDYAIDAAADADIFIIYIITPLLIFAAFFFFSPFFFITPDFLPSSSIFLPPPPLLSI